MNEGFYLGMKVSKDNEIGIVVPAKEGTAWDEEPGIIRWDTPNEKDLEDWRGLFGTFIESGGSEIHSDMEFKFIKENGDLKNT
jgi:hypothetical protein